MKLVYTLTILSYLNFAVSQEVGHVYISRDSASTIDFISSNFSNTPEYTFEIGTVRIVTFNHQTIPATTYDIAKLKINTIIERTIVYDDTLPLDTLVSRIFAFDSVGRLIEKQYDFQPNGLYSWEKYIYDANGILTEIMFKKYSFGELDGVTILSKTTYTTYYYERYLNVENGDETVHTVPVGIEFIINSKYRVTLLYEYNRAE